MCAEQSKCWNVKTLTSFLVSYIPQLNLTDYKT